MDELLSRLANVEAALRAYEEHRCPNCSRRLHPLTTACPGCELDAERADRAAGRRALLAYARGRLDGMLERMEQPPTDAGAVGG